MCLLLRPSYGVVRFVGALQGLKVSHDPADARRLRLEGVNFTRGRRAFTCTITFTKASNAQRAREQLERGAQDLLVAKMTGIATFAGFGATDCTAPTAPCE